MNTTDFEAIIIKALFANETVRSKVLPELKTDWFFDIDNKIICGKIIDFNAKFNKMPVILEMRRLLDDEGTLKAFDDIMKIADEECQTEFILQEIEEFVKKKLLYNASENIVKYCTSGNGSGSFAEDVATAEGFTFDQSIGFNLLEEPERLYDEVMTNEKVYKSGLKTIDELIGGGFHEKSLNLIMSATNVGKTLIMCSLATNFILAGYNVLYVTFEDSENKIGQRISQNLFDVTQADLKAMSAEEYVKCFQKTLGKIKNNRLIIKEYPEGSTNALMIETLLKELSEKKNFKPDILIVDYIGCMIPNGRPNPNLNSNTMLLTVAAQIRAIGMKNGIPVISASQTNRGGYGVSEINLSDAADSFGQNMKADAVFGVTQSEEFKEQGMYSVKLLKTRYGNRRGDITSIGVDIEKQRIFDITNFTGNQTVNIFETQTNTTHINNTSFANESVSLDDINYSDFT